MGSIQLCNTTYSIILCIGFLVLQFVFVYVILPVPDGFEWSIYPYSSGMKPWTVCIFTDSYFTHWAQDNISQMIYSNVFWFEFRLKFHWSLFLRVQLTNFSIGSDNDLVPNRQQASIWTNNDLGCHRIYASLCLGPQCQLDNVEQTLLWVMSSIDFIICHTGIHWRLFCYGNSENALNMKCAFYM